MGFARRQPPVEWCPEARQLFDQLAAELETEPNLRAAPQLNRPVVFRGRTIVVAAHADGIAVRLAGAAREAALQAPGAHPLYRKDGLVVRGMVALPWSAHDEWREHVRATVRQP